MTGKPPQDAALGAALGAEGSAPLSVEASLSVEAALRQGANALSGSPTPRLDARVLMKHLLGTDDAGLIARGAQQLSGALLRDYAALTARRAAGEPVAYITGEKEFWSLPFRVTPDVLIPREDSECLIEAALARRDPSSALSMLDLGTGSGCLLGALLSAFANADGVGVDRSGAALSVARANAARLGLAGRARFVAGDWGGALRPPRGGFDLIIANPPYIREGAALPPSVVEHEPASALFAGADGLDAYRALLADGARLLGAHGLLLLEIGSEQAEAVVQMVSESFPDAAISRLFDLAGRPRGVAADRAETEKKH